MPLLGGRPNSLDDGGTVDEVHGWKVARIADPQAGMFTGYAFGHYGLSARANCVFHKTDHVAPANGCDCGFNAMKQRSAAELLLSRWRGFVLLEVDLYGTVVEHRLGWRAEEQDILRIHVPRRCSRGWCKAPTEGLRKRHNGWFPSCQSHLGRDGVDLAVLRRHGVDVVLDTP
jgi:hypothetical protein